MSQENVEIVRRYMVEDPTQRPRRGPLATGKPSALRRTDKEVQRERRGFIDMSIITILLIIILVLVLLYLIRRVF